MNNNKPRNVTIFANLAYVASFALLLSSCGLIYNGMVGIGDAQTDSLSRDWLPYFTAYLTVGMTWAVGAAAYGFAAYSFIQRKSWARPVFTWTAVIIALGWVWIKIISLYFRDPAPAIGLGVLFPMFYLYGGEARAYLESGEKK
jgi:hypothetical protein